jgi:hypothetical protein
LAIPLNNKNRELTTRFDVKFIVFKNQYKGLTSTDFAKMFRERGKQMPRGKAMEGIANFGQAMYVHKFSSDFSVEMSRSARKWLEGWANE